MPDANAAPTPQTTETAATPAASNPESAKLAAELAQIRADQKILADTIAATKPIDLAQIKAEAEAAVKAEIEARAKADGEVVAKAAARQATLERIAREKLGGDAELAALLQGETDEQLTASADKMAAKLKTLKPDFGGVQKDGGTVPAGAGNDKSFTAFLK